jgi:hypothetical protein
MQLLLRILIQVWLDQAIIAPGLLTLSSPLASLQANVWVVAVAAFFGSMSVLEGKGHEAVTRIKSVSFVYSEVSCALSLISSVAPPGIRTNITS